MNQHNKSTIQSVISVLLAATHWKRITIMKTTFGITPTAQPPAQPGSQNGLSGFPIHRKGLARPAFLLRATALCALLCSVRLAAQPLQPEVLHVFHTTIANPGPLIQARDGSLCGTTQFGGNDDSGTVFSLTTNGVRRILASFTYGGPNGWYPSGGIIQAADGAIYGTTRAGGASNHGTVFRLSPDGTLGTLASFSDSPGSGLLQANDGNFYGIIASGGSAGWGSVFQLTPAGVMTTLVSFTGANGEVPVGLVEGADGACYGVTAYGGTNTGSPFGEDGAGTVFRVTADGTLTTLAQFDGTNGAFPIALVQGRDGTLYGETQFGGLGFDPTAGPYTGFGTLFRVTADGAEDVAEFYFDPNAPSSVAYPQGGLVLGRDGNVYGTAADGGLYGQGVVFQVTPAGVLTTVASLQIGYNGQVSGPLLQADDGSFYGTLSGSAPGALGSAPYDFVFRVQPEGTFTTLFGFANPDGTFPSANLVAGHDGNLYGTTTLGGASGYGTLFRSALDGTLGTLVSFDNTNGAYPTGALLQDGDGDVYGCTMGNLFRLSPAGQFNVFAEFGPYLQAPQALIQGQDGSFYGTTPAYDGGVFRVAPDGTQSLLVSFQNTGVFPTGGLVQAPDGFLYGTAKGLPDGTPGAVFRAGTNGGLTLLASFTGVNGFSPNGPLLALPDGNFYGTTTYGGALNRGTVFRLTPAGSVTALVSFAGTNGGYPTAGLLQATDGNFYGATSAGGRYNYGTVFQLTPAGVLTTLANFSGPDGVYPGGTLVQGRDGNFYGTTTDFRDPVNFPGRGTLFRLRVAPRITVQPVGLNVNAGATATFTVTAEGLAPLTYQWLKNGTNLAGATTSFLSLDQVQESDQGAYSVVVSNGLGSDTSSDGVLRVQTPEPLVLLRSLAALVHSACRRPQPLLAKLDAAIASLERGHPAVAIEDLHAFEKRVQAQVSPSDPQLGQTLIQTARDIIGLLAPKRSGAQAGLLTQ